MIWALDSQGQMSLCVKLQLNCDKRNEHMPPGKIMTSNDFLSPLHKERQVRGHQLPRKINAAARCRSSGEGDQRTPRLARPEEEDAVLTCRPP